MCGIHVVVVDRSSSSLPIETPSSLGSEEGHHDFPEWLVQRGPDHCGRRVLQSTNDKGSHITVSLQASVLRMREHLIPQPVQIDTNSDSDSGSNVFLAWNGEVYQIRNDSGEIEDVWTYEQSDTELIAKLVRQAIEHDGRSSTSTSTSADGDSQSLLTRLAGVLSTLVNAEFAFCLLTPEAVYYARDSFGRRSLLVSSSSYDQSSTSTSTLTPAEEDGGDDSGNDIPIWQLSSVATQGDGFIYKEVEPGQICSYTFQSGETQCMPWKSPSSQLPTPVVKSEPDPESKSLTAENPQYCIEQASLQLEALLLNAVRRRLTGPAAVLFSGGLDSVVLAGLALQVLSERAGDNNEPLLLINVSFVNDRTATNNPVSADTQAAIASYEDLLQIYPEHSMRFLQVQAEWSEIQAYEGHIQNLVHPKNTTMDVNIAAALWFAARAASDECRILITGLGADEQMGGYGRHRKAWERGGAEQLRQELDLDMGRLWDRNLGRDDRVLSDSSKEARFPFLDPDVVQFLQSQPLENVVDFSLPPGQGDKRILRLVAARLGLPAASTAVKRAIQFGSRIAHVSDKQRFGSRRKAKGVASVPQSES
jgi:asparagine synthetase B (glutamine-hydrolysing)